MYINKFTVKSILSQITPTICEIKALRVLNTPDNDSYVLILYFIGLDGYYHSFCHLQEELEDFSAIEAIADYLCGLSFDDIMNSRLELFSEFKFTTYPFTFNIEDIIED